MATRPWSVIVAPSSSQTLGCIPVIRPRRLTRDPGRGSVPAVRLPGLFPAPLRPPPASPARSARVRARLSVLTSYPVRVQMRTEISARHQRLKTTMIHVTHDQVEAMTMADKIVRAEAGELALECLAPPPAHLPA